MFEKGDAETRRGRVAGLYEGEGSAWHQRRRGRRGFPRLELSMKDEGPVRAFHADVGFGSVHRTTRGMWRWQADGHANARVFALWVGGLLSPRRQRQLDKAIHGN